VGEEVAGAMLLIKYYREMIHLHSKQHFADRMLRRWFFYTEFFYDLAGVITVNGYFGDDDKLGGVEG